MEESEKRGPSQSSGGGQSQMNRALVAHLSLGESAVIFAILFISDVTSALKSSRLYAVTIISP